MRKKIIFVVSFFLLGACLSAQMVSVKLKVRAILIDKDLNLKPVPKLTIILRNLADTSGAAPTTLKTGFDGIAVAELPPGHYEISTPEPVEFQGKRYAWKQEITLSPPEQTVELSNDNATISEAAAERSSRPVDELTALYKRLQNSVVDVWTEYGGGTGFIVDPQGLILTNQHVIGTSEYIAVQFDEKRKINALVLAANTEKDLAVLWANLTVFPEAVVAPLAKVKGSEPLVVEGERVFTISNPLTQQKIMTTGVVSRVEAQTIISDININPGSSGAPLFNSAGAVIGIITSIEQQHRAGPGLSHILRLEAALPPLADAQTKMAGKRPPEPTLLPVMPKDKFPPAALKELAQGGKLDKSPYLFTLGDYNVAVITPVLSYYWSQEEARKEAKEKEKRLKKGKEGSQATSSEQPEKRKERKEEEYEPVLVISVRPQAKLKFWASYGTHQNLYKFKADFYKMKLLCGEKEIQPIEPRKIRTAIRSDIDARDVSYRGVYLYPFDAITPACGQVVLQVYSEADRNQPVVKVLDAKTVQKVSSDFEPYRIALSSKSNQPQ